MTYLEKQFLTILRNNLLLARWGKKKRLAKGQGSTMNWRRWTDLTDATTALAEGASPSGSALTLNSVTGTLAQYGAFVTITDFLSMTAVNDVMTEALDLIGYNGASTVDAVIRNVIDTASGGFTHNFADPANNTTIANVESGADEFGTAEILAATEDLRAGNAPAFDDGLYVGVIHPFAEANLLSQSAAGTAMEFLKYTDSSPMVKGLIGSIYGVKLHRSAHIRADATSTNTYRNLIFGKDAYGIVDIESGALQLIVHPTGSAGSEDPLNQRATVGFKVTMVAVTLEAARGRTINAYGV